MFKKRSIGPLILLSLLVVLSSVSLVSAATEVDTSELRAAVTVDGIREHQAALQAIADDPDHDDTRAAGTPGYEASANYVQGKLEGAGYQVTVQTFDFTFFQEVSPSVLEQITPNPTVYPPNDVAGFAILQYSGSGDVTALVQPTNDIVIPPSATPSSTSGCEAQDFLDGHGNSLVTDKIALIQRGTCTFAQKAQNAEAAGALGVIIFNEGQPGRIDAFGGTLGGPVVTIPVVGANFFVGEELYHLSQEPDGVTVPMFVEAITEVRPTVNIIGETPGGRGDRVVVVGAHLDSVLAGPGINDNGSGSATILEIAEEMAALGIAPTNKVRFAFWGAEESGLLGSEYYVSQLSPRQIKNIAVNLNFDMVGSPNYVRFVYDGDGSATPLAGPNGSKTIEQVFLDYFGGVPTKPTAFDGRSDYGPFIAVGIPAGGLFTGAEGIKTAEEAATYGGTAGEPYDPCYHLACDTYDGTNTALARQGLDEMSDAAAHAVLTFAQTTSAVNGTDKGRGSPKWIEGMAYRGSHLVK